jgi:hypothetical protein
VLQRYTSVIYFNDRLKERLQGSLGGYNPGSNMISEHTANEDMYFMMVRCFDEKLMNLPRILERPYLLTLLAKNDDTERTRKLLEICNPELRFLLFGISAASDRSNLDLFCMLFSRLEYADVSFILIFRLFVKPSNLKLFQDA